MKFSKIIKHNKKLHTSVKSKNIHEVNKTNNFKKGHMIARKREMGRLKTRKAQLSLDQVDPKLFAL